ncbi:hypothetical protein BHM03_00004653 [Ensete ventricosum]|nr:hypothetical protein BHM03_00004653 [Ensete ventricosum]
MIGSDSSAACRGSLLRPGPCKGIRLLPRLPARGGQVATGAGSHPQLARKGRSPCNTHRKAAYGQRHRPQGRSLIGVTARRDNACRGGARGGATCGNDACPQGRLPKGNGSHPRERAVATTGKGNRHLRNGVDDSGGGVVRARAVGLGFLFNKRFL